MTDPPVRGRPKYPWPETADGRWRAAEQGTDFDCKPVSFRTALYRWAARHGMQASASVSGSVVKYRLAPIPPRSEESP